MVYTKKKKQWILFRLGKTDPEPEPELEPEPAPESAGSGLGFCHPNGFYPAGVRVEPVSHQTDT